MKMRSYVAIDLKSFYASVECMEMGLDPLDTCLVVADESRTEKTIGLAPIVNAQIGVSIKTGTSGAMIAPPAEREYAVEPVGVEINAPSPAISTVPSPLKS